MDWPPVGFAQAEGRERIGLTYLWDYRCPWRCSGTPARPYSRSSAWAIVSQNYAAFKTRKMSKDHALAFSLLDKERKGYLSKPEAVKWVRSRGCCGSDEDIERCLLSRAKTRGDGEPRYTLPMLSKVDEMLVSTSAIGQSLVADERKLADSLCVASGVPDGDRQVSIFELKEALTSSATTPMTPAEFEALLANIKLPRNSDLVAADSLAHFIIKTIKP